MAEGKDPRVGPCREVIKIAAILNVTIHHPSNVVKHRPLSTSHHCRAQCIFLCEQPHEPSDTSVVLTNSSCRTTSHIKSFFATTMSSFPPSVPPNPLQRQPTSPSENITSKLSLVTLVVCPVLALLPPRKLDLYTFSLGAAFVVAANHQTQLRSGKGILLNIYARRKEESDQKQRQKTWEAWEADESGTKGLAKRIWMGDAKADWKEKRMQEERENAEQGKGISDVIIDQVKEVWGVPKEDDDREESSKKA